MIKFRMLNRLFYMGSPLLLKKNPRFSMGFLYFIRLRMLFRDIKNKSDVEQEVHHVAVFDDVLFAF